MTINLEQTILNNILVNEPYMRTVLPFIRADYFEGVYKAIFLQIGKYVAKYNKLPTKEAFKIELDQSTRISEDTYSSAVGLIDSIFNVVDTNQTWLMDITEKWCQDKAVHNAIIESISIIDGKHETLTKNALPDILSKALAVSFDTTVGHDYIENATDRYNFYHEQEERIPFDLDMLNKITKGGLPKKTLNIILAGTGVGKSLFMCHCAASALMQGKNVLYITMEMAEERIAERIDANLMDIPLAELEFLPQPIMATKIGNIAARTSGKLIIKEYPTGQANTSHFRALLNELKLKRSFIPDIIFVDYLNICSSARVKAMGGSINSYTYIKSIAEEMRGLAVEFNVPIVSATQTTRSGFTSSDPGLEDTSESFGLPATADLMLALISTEDLEALGQIMVKQLKNRYNDINLFKRFVIGVDRSKMKLYDVQDSTQGLYHEPTLQVRGRSDTATKFDEISF